MASVYVVKRETKAGDRWHVKYRVGGKAAKVRHAGVFITEADAKIRLELVHRQLAGGATVIRFTDEPEPHGRWIYFIRHGESGPIKIGSARNINGRLRELQTGNPVQLNVIGIMPCYRRDQEFELHASFAHARLNGEWFRPTDDLLAYVSEFQGPVEKWEDGLSYEPAHGDPRMTSLQAATEVARPSQTTVEKDRSNA